MSDDPERPAAGSTPDPVERAPRTGGNVARSPSVQIALLVLAVMLGLLALWVAWSLMSAVVTPATFPSLL